MEFSGVVWPKKVARAVRAKARGRVTEMTEVISHAGKDPMIFLTNGTRTALKLEGPSDRPKSVVQAAQDAYYKATGTWPYVQGMPNSESPDPPPPPPKTTIGTVVGTGDLVNDKGDTVSFDEGTEATVTAEFDGDAEDVTYKWEIRTGGEYVSIVGSSTEAAVVISADGSGGPASIRCTLTSANSTDSPVTLTMNVVVKTPSGPTDE